MPGRPPRPLLTALLCMLLLALIGGARALQIAPGEITDTLEYSGSAEETVDANRFTMEVRDVEFARAISDGDLSELATDDIWLLVTATLVATDDRLGVEQPVVLQTGDGYSYAASPLVMESLAGGKMETTRLEPGIPVTAVAVFELPPDRILDPKLRVSAGDMAGWEQPLSGAAVADLGMSRSDVRDGVGNAADDVEIPDIHIGEPGAGSAADEGGARG